MGDESQDSKGRCKDTYSYARVAFKCVSACGRLSHASLSSFFPMVFAVLIDPAFSLAQAEAYLALAAAVLAPVCFRFKNSLDTTDFERGRDRFAIGIKRTVGLRTDIYFA